MCCLKGGGESQQDCFHWHEMLEVLGSASFPATEVVLFKTNMNVYHGTTKIKGGKLQFNAMPVTNLF